MVDSYNKHTTVNGRRSHSIFEDAIKEVISEKKIENAKQQARDEAKREAEQNRGIFGLFG